MGIITKSNLVVRDIELLSTIARNNRLFVNLTITTLNTDLARLLEPRAPRPDLRMEALRKLSQAGIPTGVSCSPVLPGITDSPRDLSALVQAAAQAGAKHIFANPLFLKPCSAAIFMPFLEKEFPKLADSYKQRYQGRAFVTEPYRKRLAELMQSLREKHGMVNRFERYQRLAPGADAVTQPGLF
jgi:DNA repair photolyase